MQKILTIAKREYQALVRTKAFIISLLVMPVFALGGIFIQTYDGGSGRHWREEDGRC